MILVCTCMVCATSCSESDDSDTEYDNWQQRNVEHFELMYQRALDSIAKNPTKWKLIKAYSRNPDTEGAHTDYIIVHVLSQKAEHEECTKPSYAESPYYTDSVRVHIRRYLMPSVSYNVKSEGFGGFGFQFDSSWLGEYNPQTMVPQSYAVGGDCNAFATAVMNMHLGDRWEICVPYPLTDGSTISSTIPSYSMMFFDITLHSFARSGEKWPAFQ